MGAVATAMAGVLVAAVVVTSGGGPKPPAVDHAITVAPGREELSTPSVANGTPKSAAPAAAAPAVHGASGAAGGASAPSLTTATSSSSGSRSASGSSGAAAASTPPAVVPAAPSAYNAQSPAAPAPVPNGRRVVTSSTLALGAAPKRIDAVAQEVFNVVADVNAYVVHSQVASTGGMDANAQFELKVPSSNLSQALTLLSRMRYASVISRIDSTQDVNNSYLSTQRGLAAARRTLASLRRQLRAATTYDEIATLDAEIASTKATIAADVSSIASLNRRIDYSRVYVSLQATAGSGNGSGGGDNGGFGIGKAGHDALRVLEVSAGVALIALAVLVPIALLGALGWWIGMTVQRRRRERALDLA
jgi:hypothetical protein